MIDGGGDFPPEGGAAGRDDAGDRMEERLRRLAAENERLRQRPRPGRGTRYRNLALALAAVGAATFAAGWFVPTAREVLFALGGTGVFAGILVVFLTPDRYIAATVGGDVYASLAANLSAMVGELGLTDVHVYFPREGTGVGTVSLFVPQHADFSLPAAEELDEVFVVSDDETARGISLSPSAGALLADFTTTGSTGLEDQPVLLATQLADGLREGYGLVDDVSNEVDVAGGQATFAVSGGAFGPVDRFDNPVCSFLAGGLALGLWKPVTLEVTEHGGSDFDHVVTCRWSTDDGWSAPNDA